MIHRIRRANIGVKQLLSDRASDARANTTAIVLDDIIIAINHGKVLVVTSLSQRLSISNSSANEEELNYGASESPPAELKPSTVN